MPDLCGLDVRGTCGPSALFPARLRGHHGHVQLRSNLVKDHVQGHHDASQHGHVDVPWTPWPSHACQIRQDHGLAGPHTAVAEMESGKELAASRVSHDPHVLISHCPSYRHGSHGQHHDGHDARLSRSHAWVEGCTLVAHQRA